jgi:transposase
MGRREGEQEDLFVTHQQLRSQSHPFYRAVNRVLADQGFDRYVERLCSKFYAKRMGRPGLAPAIYFRSLLLGFFEGIDSERGIAWRAADSLSLRDFLGVPASKLTPDHSTISRTRRLIDLETHQAVFTWVLSVLDGAGLVKGKTIGVDATTLEANAAMRSIVRRDDGRTYQTFLEDLAKASGIDTPTREDLARIDRKRKKKGSNDDWFNPNDADAKITKMKDGQEQQPQQEAVYANRRRKNGRRGRALMRLRGELIERPFAHAFETGGMRRTHLRKHENIAKRLLVHIAGLNLALLMRTRFGVGKPRCLQGRGAALTAAFTALLRSLLAFCREIRSVLGFAPITPPLAIAYVWP